MKKRKFINMLIIVMMFLSYLAPVSQVFATEPNFQVNLEDITKVSEQDVELTYNITVESTIETPDSIVLFRNGVEKILDVHPLNVNPTEDGNYKVLSYIYSESINPEDTSVDYYLAVTVGGITANSAVKTWTADEQTEIPGDPAVEPEQNTIQFADPNLEIAIKELLGIDEATPVTSEDMELITDLSLENKNISDLNGLEYATQLRSLSLAYNPISSIEPILGLKGLGFIDLSHSAITSINGIENLDELYHLGISYTNVTDLSPLLNAVNPYYVDAYGIPADLTGDERNVNLINQLNEKGFQIYYETNEDGSLSIQVHSVTDTSIDLSWEFNGSQEGVSYQVYVNEEPYGDITTETNYTINDLLSETDYEIKVEAYKEDGSLLETAIIPIKTLAAPTGDVITIEDPALEEVIREGLSIYNRALTVSDIEGVTSIYGYGRGIASLKGLEYAKNLMYLSLDENNITDLSPIKDLSQLEVIELSGNPIASINALDDMTNIRHLNLSDTELTNIATLTTLQNLQYVDLRYSNIDFNNEEVRSVLKELSNKGVEIDFINVWFDTENPKTTDNSIYLKWNMVDEETAIIPTSYKVYVNGNLEIETSDLEYTIENLESDTQYNVELIGLWEGINVTHYSWEITTGLVPTGDIIQIEDQALENLIREELWIHDRPLQVSDLESLEYLNGYERGIVSLKGLEYAINLRELYLNRNNVSDISPIKELNSLNSINLSENPITDLSPLVNLENLTNVNVRNVNIDYISDEVALEIIKTLANRGVEVEFISVWFNSDTPKPTQDSILLSWNPVIEESEYIPTSYKVFLDGKEIVATEELGYTITGLNPETEYSIKVVGLWNDIPVVSDYWSVQTTKIPSGDVVVFEDEKLEAAIREELWVYDRDIRSSDMENLYRLDAENSDINSLSGLEYAVNLQDVFLGGNAIQDLSPLANLNNLNLLDLSFNPVYDITALKGLVSLGSLNLTETGITDITALLDMTGLYWVGVKYVAIDYSTDEEAKEVINQLKNRGVDVAYKDFGDIYINKAKATDKSIYLEWSYYGYNYETGEELAHPAYYKIFLNEKEVTDVQGTTYSIENLEPDTEYNIRIEGYTNGQFTEEFSIENVSTVSVPTGEIVTIEDPSLEEIIREELWVHYRPLLEGDLSRLTWLEADYRNISSLSGLENATNLEELSLRGNRILDLSSLKDLKNLTTLSLGYNRITDLKPLEVLINLKYLGLENNLITDISSLGSLVNLEGLGLERNKISNIEVVSKLINIDYLDLDYNQIKDLTPLAGNGLVGVFLSNNPITNIEPLIDLTNVYDIDLRGTLLDLSPESKTMEIINSLRERDVYVSTSEGDFKEFWLDTYDITENSASLNWYSNVNPSLVSSAKITVYAFEDSGWDVTDDVYRDVYADVYEEVYQDVYEKGSVEAIHEVNYSDYSYTIDGLKSATDYAFVMELTLKDESEPLTEQVFLTTKWSADQLVEEVTFRLVDNVGEIVPDAEVSIEGADSNNSKVFHYGYTNSEGLFQSMYESGTSLALPEGDYYVYILGNGKYENNYQIVTVNRDGIYPIDVIAQEIEAEKASVTLKVTDQSGNPIKALEYVSFYSQKMTNRFGYEFGAYQQWGLYSDNGIYEFNNLTVADDYLINLESKDYKIWSESNAAITPNKEFIVVLDKGAEVKAQIKNNQGQLLTGANYSIYGNSSNAYGTIKEAGLLHESGLNEEYLTVEVNMEGYLSYTTEVKADQFVDGLADLGEITLEPEKFIDGHVYKTKPDEPVKNASVMLYAEGEKYESYWTRTDSDGYFKIRNVKPGKYKIKAEAYNLPTAETEINAGETAQMYLAKDATGAFAGEGNSFIPSKSSAVPGETVEYRLNYSNNSQSIVNNVDFTFTLPEGVELIAESLLVSNKKADSSKFSPNKVVRIAEIPAGEKGTISFKVKVKETAVENINSSASIITHKGTVNLNSSLSLTFVTLNGPEVTAETKVKLYGSAKAGSKVQVYDGNKLLVETVVPTNSKWWYADVQLPIQSGVESKHQLIAKTTSNDNTASSAPLNIQYSPSIPKIKEISITAGWNKDVKLNPYTGVASMAIVEFTPIKLKAKFDQTIDKATLKFLGESYSFINKGEYYEATIPGTWSSYGEQLMELFIVKGGQTFKMPILEAIVLIDPSGYVFEGSMSNRLSGVTAVVEEQTDEVWRPWNAAAFAQVNPQLTDEEGRYGWVVPQGAWRVIFSKENYVKYTSRTVYVPPAETELNVPMVRTTLPIIEQTSIVDGAENIAASSDIVIKFDRLMDEGTVNSNIKVVDQKGNIVNGLLTGEEHYFGYKEVDQNPGYFEEDRTKLLSQTFTWKADNELDGGAYRLVISNDVTDYSGKKLENSKTINFTVADTTAPEKPVVNDVTDKSTTVTGKAEPGASIVVKTASSIILGTAIVKADGSFSTVIPIQKAGTELFVTATDLAKLTSEATKIKVRDITAPGVPVVNMVSDKSSEVTGTAETGSTVIVLIGTNKYYGASKDGKFKVIIPVQKAGTRLSITAMDATKNISKTVDVTVLDKTAPGIPVVNLVSDKSKEVTGTAEVGTTVIVLIGTNKYYSSSKDGKYKVTIPLQKAGNKLSVIAEDAAKNVSLAKVITVLDKTAPSAPAVNTVTDKAKEVTGKAEAGSTVTVIIGSKKYYKQADAKGTYKVIIPLQKAGTKLSVTATDAVKNTSSAKAVTVLDKTAPKTPVVSTVSDNAKYVTGSAETGSTVTVWIGKKKYFGKSVRGKFKVTIPKQKAGIKLKVTSTDVAKNVSGAKYVTVLDKTAPKAPKVSKITSKTQKVTGTAEAYSVITFKVGSKVIGSGKANKKGKFSVKIKAQKKKVTISITSKDKAKNTSKATKVKVK
jgi:uncharacterized repeat protein (TIGR01451 family)